MKLIIDIPEEEYERIKDIPNDYKLLIHKAVANGTPLDDVKAEIDEQYDRVKPYNIDVAEGLEMALEIINKHISGKEN